MNRVRGKVVSGCAMALLMTGCLTATERGHGGVPRLARLTLEVRIGADGQLAKPGTPVLPKISVSGGASKTAVTLDHMIVTLTSGKLVLRDTVTPMGSRLSREPAYLNPLSTYPQSLLLRYELKPDRPWVARVQVFDDRDSMRYAGELDIADMDAFEYLNGCLPVDPRFGVYETRMRLPAAIEADGIPGSGRGLRALYFDRLDLRVNGDVVMSRLPGITPTGARDERFEYADTAYLARAGTARFFRPTDVFGDAPMTLSYDYVSLNASEFEVDVYGYVQGDTLGVTPERLLYRGQAAVNIATAKVSVEDPVEMVWQAVDAVPSGVTATEMSVRLGRAGKVVMNVVVPGGVAL